MADLEGGFSKRISATLISTVMVLALLGWAFQLGVQFSTLATVQEEVDKLRKDSESMRDDIAELKVAIEGVKIFTQSMDQTLKEIRTDFRQVNKDRLSKP